MNAPRFVVYILGLILVGVALWMLFVQTGINRWVPFGILAFVVLLVIGLGVMGSADRLDEDETTVIERRRVE